MTPAHRFVAIFNPRADRGRAGRAAEALRRCAEGRFDLQLRETACRGDAVRLARQAANDGCRAVVAVGGDGTVHEVVNGLMESPREQRPALAVVPAGSGNDVAYALAVPRHASRLLELLEQGEMRTMDIGRVQSAAGRQRYWANNVGTLLEGRINLASHKLRWPKGPGLYLRAVLQTLLRKLPAARLEMIVDGVPHHREASILSIGNGPRSGGCFFINPAAQVDDGRLDYLLAPPMGRLALLANLGRLSRREPLADKRVEYGQFQRMTVRSDEPLPVHVDGEPWLTPDDDVRELSIEVLAGALQVLGSERDGPAAS